MLNSTQTIPREYSQSAACTFVDVSASEKRTGAGRSNLFRNQARFREQRDEMKYWKTILVRLLLSGLRGAVCGLGISFFMFLRLGMPRDAETAGYISGLFLLAGLEFDLTVEVIRSILSLILKEKQSCKVPEKASGTGFSL